MKIDYKVKDVQGNITGERIKMDIDHGATVHLMTILTDIAKNPERYAAVETWTNAFDSHLESNVDRPVEISLPGPLDPFLRTRDYGAGLDEEDIRNIYSKYGASTKRNTNDLVGMLGLGAKAPLTYADQFIVRGIKNGMAIDVSVSREENGQGVMTILNDGAYETDEPSGVEVAIPAKTGNKFEEIANDVLRFWPEGSVLVNGKPPRRIDGIWISDDIVITSEVRTSKLVMGNVAYDIPNTRFYRFKYVAFVPIGSVNFTPSREELQMDEHKTKPFIRELENKVERVKNVAILKQIADASDHFEAFKLAVESSRYDVPWDQMVYDGKSLPSYLHRDMEKQERYYIVRYKPTYARGTYWDDSYSLPLSTPLDSKFKTVFLEDYDNKNFTPTRRAKLQKWAGDKFHSNGEDISNIPQYYILVDSLTAEEKYWTKPEQLFSWDDVKGIKIAKENVTTSRGKRAGAYKGFIAGTYTHEIMADEIDDTKPIFWHNRYTGRSDVARKYNPDCYEIEVPDNRLEKFKRMFPSAQSSYDYAQKKMKDWATSLTDDEKKYLHIQVRQRRADIPKLNPEDIEDPDIKEWLRIARLNVNGLMNDYKYYQQQNPYNYSDVMESISDPFENYPLLSNNYYWQNDVAHAVLYINAVYQARKENVNV